MSLRFVDDPAAELFAIIAISARHSLDATGFLKQDDTTGGLYRAMAFVSIAIALRAWTEHFGWTAAPEKTLPAALFGLSAVFKIRPVEAGLHDAARALRRAFIPHRRSVDTELSGRDILPEPTIPPDAESSAADTLVTEAPALNPEVVTAQSRRNGGGLTGSVRRRKSSEGAGTQSHDGRLPRRFGERRRGERLRRPHPCAGSAGEGGGGSPRKTAA